jgi:hypothetical protein
VILGRWHYVLVGCERVRSEMDKAMLELDTHGTTVCYVSQVDWLGTYTQVVKSQLTNTDLKDLS